MLLNLFHTIKKQETDKHKLFATATWCQIEKVNFQCWNTIWFFQNNFQLLEISFPSSKQDMYLINTMNIIFTMH